MGKYRIAFIHPSGLTAGGTERWLQMMAAHLPKEQFQVDYFYSSGHHLLNSARKPIRNQQVAALDQGRRAYLEEHGITLRPFKMKGRIATKSSLPWVETDFWQVFDPSQYHLVQTAKSGRWYPYHLLKVPVVEYVTLVCAPDLSENIVHSIHLSNWQRQKWLSARPFFYPIEKMVQRSSLIPIPATPPTTKKDLRNELGIPLKAIVCGFHQRNSEYIFSPIPLQAFKELVGSLRYFLILGGADAYRRQAIELGIENKVIFLEHSSDQQRISEFLNTLDIFAHGRRDGETFGTVFAEAMMHGIPCLSHFSEIGANAHQETMGPGGVLAKDFAQYKRILRRFLEDDQYRYIVGSAGKIHAEEHYSLETCVESLSDIYQGLLEKNSNNLTKDPKIFYGSSPLGFLYAGKPKPAELAWHVVVDEIPEPYEVEIVRTILPNIRRFLDVGSNTGLYCCLAGNEIPTEKVINAIEPQPDCVSALRKTIQLNNWENFFYVHEIGLGEKTGAATLQLSGTGSSFCSKFIGKTHLESIEIPIKRLDDWAIEQQIDFVDFIKIEVKGTEWQVIQGATNTIQVNLPILFIEIAKTLKSRGFQHQDYQNLLSWLIGLGYIVRWVNKKGEFKKLSDQVPDGVFMYLALHPKTSKISFEEIEVQIKKYKRKEYKNKWYQRLKRLKHTLKPVNVKAILGERWIY